MNQSIFPYIINEYCDYIDDLYKKIVQNEKFSILDKKNVDVFLIKKFERQLKIEGSGSSLMLEMIIKFLTISLKKRNYYLQNVTEFIPHKCVRAYMLLNHTIQIKTLRKNLVGCQVFVQQYET